MTAPALLQTRSLAVGYRRRQKRQPVLSGLNLTVARGEFICLLGPNGIGKSTLLRTLAGLQAPLAGRVELGGVDINNVRPFDRAQLIGVVLSERISVGALRARQMVGLGRYAHGGWNGRLSERDLAVVDTALASVGASHLADRDCRELSDGELQKLNLARALAQEPALIILDEPTAFLDVTARVDLVTLLRGLTRSRDVAVVASTHDLDLALRNADMIWLADRDRQLRSGAPEDLILQDAFGAAFSSDAAQFESDGLRFHARLDNAPTATVHGPAAARRLAATVLEREGFRIAADGEDSEISVDLTGDGSRWRATDADGDVSGPSFAALAAFARHAFTGSLRPVATKKNQPSQSRG